MAMVMGMMGMTHTGHSVVPLHDDDNKEEQEEEDDDDDDDDASSQLAWGGGAQQWIGIVSFFPFEVLPRIDSRSSRVSRVQVQVQVQGPRLEQGVHCTVCTVHCGNNRITDRIDSPKLGSAIIIVGTYAILVPVPCNNRGRLVARGAPY